MKNVIKSVSFLLAFCFIICLLPAFAEGEEDDIFSVDSEYAIIMNAESGTVLYSKNSETTFFCGFLPRLVLCMLLIDSGFDLDTEIKLTSEMMSVSHDKSSANLVAGEKITLRDLMKCVLVGNSQEASIAIAMTLSDSVSSCVAQMNAKVNLLGATNTEFANVTGQYSQSSAEKSRTTVRDIAIIIASAVNYEYIEDYTNKRYIEVSVNGSYRQVFNKNLMMDTYSEYYYKRASGLQISGNKETGFAMVSLASGTSMNLISVAVNYNSALSLYDDIKSMISFSLTEYASRTLISKNIPVAEIDVLLGKNRNKLTLVAKKTITVSIPQSIPDSEIYADIEIPESVTAPVSKGDAIGTVTYIYDGQSLGSTELIAQSSVSLDYVGMYTERINEVFGSVYFWLILGFVVLSIILYTVILVVNNRKKIRSEMRKSRSRFRPK